MVTRWVKNVVRAAAGRFGVEVRRAGPPDHGSVSMGGFLRHLDRLGIRPACVLDVGANRGEWSRTAAGVFPDARFVLIEPQPELAPHLAAFCDAHPAARVVAAGAGAAVGQAVQTIWDDLAGSSFLPPASDELLRAGRQRATPVVTIDSVFAADEPLPELAKLDIQGYELEALKGATRLFGRTECFILEVSLHRFSPNTPDLFQVVEFMHARGYLVYDLCGLLRRPLDGALGQVDLAFGRADGPLFRDSRWGAGG